LTAARIETGGSRDPHMGRRSVNPMLLNRMPCRRIAIGSKTL
jgi:hypothetical protein